MGETSADCSNTVFFNQVLRKDTYTFGEEFTVGGVLNPAPAYDGPLSVVTGIYDFPFCLGNCSYPDNQLAKVQPSLYPGVPDSKSDVYLVPENGHYLNTHRSAPLAFAHINAFLANNGF